MVQINRCLKRALSVFLCCSFFLSSFIRTPFFLCHFKSGLFPSYSPCDSLFSLLPKLLEKHGHSAFPKHIYCHLEQQASQTHQSKSTFTTETKISWDFRVVLNRVEESSLYTFMWTHHWRWTVQERVYSCRRWRGLQERQNPLSWWLWAANILGSEVPTKGGA